MFPYLDQSLNEFTELLGAELAALSAPRRIAGNW
jgi:hypothetical protein